MRSKIGIFIENRFIDKEIIYYLNRFADDGFETVLLTRLWGQPELTFKGMELGMEVTSGVSFERLTDQELSEYAAIIMPAGYVADYLLYSEKPKEISPAAAFVRKIMSDKRIVKGFICHALWIAAPIKEAFEGRTVTCHNNIIAHVENAGMIYADEDVCVDEDLVTARAGDNFGVFSSKIIETIREVRRKMSKKVLVCASNYGFWGEELQASWDALNKAGHQVTLATPKGKKPLPLKISVDPDFFDVVQKCKVNPKEVCDRVKELVDGDEWANPVSFKEAKMADYDAIVLIGGLGPMLDMANDYNLHKLLRDAFYSDKLIGAICYSVATLVFCRDPKMDYKSIVYGKTITAHPRAWDFYGPDMDAAYELYGETEDNKGTDVHTPGFLYPIEDLIRDAVGPNGFCVGRNDASREDPEVNFCWPFVTAASVESSIAYGELLVKVLNDMEKNGK